MVRKMGARFSTRASCGSSICDPVAPRILSAFQSVFKVTEMNDEDNSRRNECVGLLLEQGKQANLRS